MKVAYDADVLYDMQNELRQIGRIEHLIGWKELDPTGTIIVWSNKGIRYTRKIITRAGIPDIVKVIDRIGYLDKDVDLEFATMTTGQKARMTLRIGRPDEASKTLVRDQN